MDRIVFLGSPIDDNVANIIVAQLLFLEAEDPERDIFMYINCPGGSVYAGLAIYDTMQHCGRRCPPSAWACAPPWAPSCWRRVRRASAARCRTPAS